MPSWSGPGTYTWGVPAGVSSVHAIVYGAVGADRGSAPNNAAGGLGGKVECDIAVSFGDTLDIVVGSFSNGNAGGTPGGGGDGGGNAGGGGGASWIARSGSYLVVAGGGGGASEGGLTVIDKFIVAGIGFLDTDPAPGSDGGHGGGVDGEDGTSGATGGYTSGTAGADGGDTAPGTPAGAGSITDGGNGGASGSGRIFLDGGGGGGGHPGGGGGGAMTVSYAGATIGQTYTPGGGGGGSSAAPGGTGVTYTTGVTSPNYGYGLVIITYEDAVRRIFHRIYSDTGRP